MSMSPRRSLQENLLVLLSFSAEHAMTIRNLVPVRLFEGLYHKVAQRIYDYLDKYQTPPDIHLPDLFEDELQDDQHRQAFLTIITAIQTQKSSIQSKFVLQELDRFITVQNLRSAIIEAADALQREDEDSIERAETILHQVVKKKRLHFQPGIQFGGEDSLSFLTQDPDQWTLKTGIKELDDYQLGPTKKELHLFIGLANRGKTWWLVNLGKQAIKHGVKVCHITLEMSEDKVAQRYTQALFSVAKRSVQSRMTRFDVDEHGKFVGFTEIEYTPQLAFDQPKILTALQSKFKKWKPKLNNLMIKEFPTGTLTVRELEGYLDLLDSTLHFSPDLVIIDYIDLMKVGTSNYRLDLGSLYKSIRGLAVERNIAIATVTQSSREGVNASLVSEVHVSEDYSKFMTADTVLTYSQTPLEEQKHVARIYVNKSRNERRGTMVMIAQNYELGQFVTHSALLSKQYWDQIQPPKKGMS